MIMTVKQYFSLNKLLIKHDNTARNKNSTIIILINPLLPIAYKRARIDKISILKLEGIIKKISYERRDYESVDEKSLS